MEVLPVPELKDIDVAFGNIGHLPKYSDIPEEFKRGSTKWNEITSTWFFSGLPQGTDFIPRKDVDGNKALKAIKAILVSWEPKHEHKEAGVAYLLSQWFEDVKIPDVRGR